MEVIETNEPLTIRFTVEELEVLKAVLESIVANRVEYYFFPRAAGYGVLQRGPKGCT